MDPKAKVLVPLYIYPLSEDTWKPLHQTITAHANVEFLVVVNPDSGPRSTPLPGHDYVREVPRLTAYPNVTTVGYIRIDYCKRPLDEVYKEIDTYSGWVTDHDLPGLAVSGILVDESPNHHTQARADYLDVVHKHIKASPGILGDKLIMHNPGTPPDAGLADPGPEVIVTCEEPWQKYKSEQVQKRLRDYHYEQPRSGYMISGVPRNEITLLTQELRHRGAYLFITDLVDNFYESFGPSWDEFVAAMDTA